MSNKILTVSVAAYNAQEYLEEVLHPFTVVKNINSIEVFIIDDGGTDASLDIAKKYEKMYPGVFYAVHKENGGWGSTVNYSMEHASGKFFRLLDGDDYYSSENMDEFIEYLKTATADIIITPYVSFSENKTRHQETHGFGENIDCGTSYMVEDVGDQMILSMHGITVKTALLKEKPFKLKEKVLYRDMEFTANVLSVGKTVSFFKKPIYYYRIGREGQSVSKNSYIKHSDEHEDIVFKILSISEKMCNHNRVDVFYNLARGACLQQYAIYFYAGNKNANRMKVKTYDQKIKKYPIFYESIPLPGYIRILRKTGFCGYNLIKDILPFFRKIKSIMCRREY